MVGPRYGEGGKKDILYTRHVLPCGRAGDLDSEADVGIGGVAVGWDVCGVAVDGCHSISAWSFFCILILHPAFAAVHFVVFVGRPEEEVGRLLEVWCRGSGIKAVDGGL